MASFRVSESWKSASSARNARQYDLHKCVHIKCCYINEHLMNDLWRELGSTMGNSEIASRSKDGQPDIWPFCSTLVPQWRTGRSTGLVCMKVIIDIHCLQRMNGNDPWPFLVPPLVPTFHLDTRNKWSQSSGNQLKSTHSIHKLLSLQHTVHWTHPFHYGHILKLSVLYSLFCYHACCHTAHLKAMLSLAAAPILLLLLFHFKSPSSKAVSTCLVCRAHGLWVK